MQEHKLETLLYMAGRLMCGSFHNHAQAPDSPYYVKNGPLWQVTEVDGSWAFLNKDNAKRIYMCPACPEWRNFLASQIRKIMERAPYVGVNNYPGGIYLDVTCTRPTYGGPCYNTAPNHGHPDQRGGGNHYAVGTNALLDAVRTAGQYGGNNPEFVVVAEGIGDVFLEHLDGYLHYMPKNDSFNVLPVIHVLWADKIRPFGDEYAGVPWNIDYASRRKTARAFVFGVPLTRIRKEVFNENGNQLRAIKRIINYRRNFDDFLAKGRMYAPTETNCDYNVVINTTWRKSDRILFAFANGSNETKNITADFDISECGLSDLSSYKLYQLNEDGTMSGSLGNFNSDGLKKYTFNLDPLGSNSGNKGVLCFMAKK